jgi:hypothetical protein
MKIIEEPIVDYKIKFEVVSAKSTSGYKIQIAFSDGVKKIIDFEPFISESQHPSIRKYLDLELFNQFKIVNGNLNWNDYDMIFPLTDLRNGKIS